MSKPKILQISFVLLIMLLVFAAIRQSFTLALSGDDWVIHYTIRSVFDVYKQASYFNPLTYFCTYCPHYFFSSIISRIWGYEPFYYYLASYIARVIATLGLFLLVKKLTGRAFPAVLASMFFAVTYLGIEATDWVFNYNHILDIAVYSFFLIWYFKTKDTPMLKNFLISALLFALALIISPPRMHGMFALAVVAEAGWFLIEGRKFNFKLSVLRILMLFTINYIILYGMSDLYIFIRDKFHFEIGPAFLGNGYGTREWNASRVADGITAIKTRLSQGQFDVVVEPIASLGNYIMPDTLWAKIPFANFTFLGKRAFTLTTYILPISFVWGILTYIVLKVLGAKKKINLTYITLLVVWMFFIYFLQKTAMASFVYPKVAFSLIGGFTIIFSFCLFAILKKSKPVMAHLLLLSLGWMVTFGLLPWLISPYGILLTEGRYNVQQGAGLAVWLAIIFTILIDTLKIKKKVNYLGIVYITIFLIVFMHISFTDGYLQHVNSYRNKDLINKYWNTITSKYPTIDKSGVNVYLMLTDQASNEIAEALRFGFDAKATVYYGINDGNNSPFMTVNAYDGVLSSVSDGKYLTQLGHKPIPTTVDRVYAFMLVNKELTDITQEIRAKLRNDLVTLKKDTPQNLPTTP